MTMNHSRSRQIKLEELVERAAFIGAAYALAMREGMSPNAIGTAFPEFQDNSCKKMPARMLKGATDAIRELNKILENK